ncbi:MAG: hypothetical protein C0172_02690 [Caldisphaera sp.]|nr:MAG: hypothetical protein C0172_02690 [Caldisphaera sp.]
MLVAIVGSLGKGKTLALTYLAWNNFFIKRRKIYSNYTLYGIPFTPIKTIGGLMSLMPLQNENVMEKREIVFCGDELWRWVSSRTIGKGSRERKDLVDKILMGSRKAFVTIIYTTQNLKQVDPWVRNITDLYVYPILYNNILNLYFLSNPINNPTFEQLLRYSTDKPLKVLAEPFFAMYNTYERVPMLDEGMDEMKEIVIDISKNPALQRYIFVDLGKDQEYFNKYVEKIKKKFWLYDEKTYLEDLKRQNLPYLRV